MISFYNKQISRFKTVDDVLNDCVTAIRCPITRFYPNKNFGSQIHSDLKADELLAFARAAVRNLDGVFVKSVLLMDNTAQFKILINDNIRSVNINLEQDI